MPRQIIIISCDICGVTHRVRGISVGRCEGEDGLYKINEKPEKDVNKYDGYLCMECMEAIKMYIDKLTIMILYM